MRLEITRRSDLATRALRELARTGERTKASVLAELVGTTPGFLSQAMTPLVTRGWARSEPGPTGGYTALVDPAELTVLEVIEAVEGTTDTGRCVLEDRPCSGDEACALHRPWSSARALLLKELAGTPLASLPAKDWAP
jgi:Rrf2 family iron-sulfur cluster assembly transcriptional regulator